MEEKIQKLEDWLSALTLEYQNIKQERENASTFEELVVAQKLLKRENQLHYFIFTLKEFVSEVKQFCFLEEPDVQNDLECLRYNALLNQKVYQFHIIMNREIHLFLDTLLSLKQNKNFLKIYQKMDYPHMSFWSLLRQYFEEYIPKEYFDSMGEINKECLKNHLDYQEYQKMVQEKKVQKNTLPYGCILELKQKGLNPQTLK